MNAGTLLIGLSLISALGAIFLFIQFFINKDKNLRYYAQVLTLGCFLLNSLALLLLTYYFLSSNFNFQYVWEYSAKNSQWYLKLSGVWAGQEGSLFIWAWLMLLSIALEVYLQIKKDKKLEENTQCKKKKGKKKSKKRKSTISPTLAFDWTITIAMAVVVVFILLILVKNPFDSVNPKLLENKPDGNGLNPLLRNLWMTIHPPLLFIGYALVTVPFAASMAYLISDDKKWSKISLQWSRLAWLFLTLGIGIGAIWAYVELAFGGYWAWDPVEVGSLIPWVTLTAFLHAQLMNKRKDEYKIIVSILGMATFILVIFATFITRSGFWDSVHAWQETKVGNILMGLMITTLFFGSLLAFWRFSKEDEKKEFKYSMDFVTMFSTILLLSLIAIVMLIGLLVSMGTPNPVFYETRLFPFTFPLIIILAVCLIWRYLNKENLLFTIGWVILASIACAFILPKYAFPGTPEDFYGGISSHRVVAFLVPSILFAIGACIYKVIKSIKLKSIRTTLKTISPHIIHIGIALMIISYFFSAKLVEEKTITLEKGQTVDFKEYEIKLVNIENSKEREKEIHDFTIDINKNGKSIGTKHPKYVYYSDVEQWRTDVAIKMRVTEDLYINILNVDPDSNNEIDSVKIKVQTVPLMAFLWGGMVLMSIGIIIRILIDYGIGKKEIEIEEPVSHKKTRKKEKSDFTKKKGDEKYEKMLEQELKKI